MLQGLTVLISGWSYFVGLQALLALHDLETHLLTLLQGTEARALDSAELHEDKGQSIAPSFVKRIEHYIEEHAHEPISVGDLAEYAGVSTRSLFSAFRRFRNISPMHYLKEVRLRRVHDELQQAQPSSGTVTAVAFRWGFSHLGHFTTDYKRRFGETPSETLMRS